MKAWQFVETNEPLVLNEVPEPVPGAGEVIIAVQACGLCHSDVTYMTHPGTKAAMPYTPMTLGHETAGVISAVGPGVTGWQVGDRVGVCPSGKGFPGFFTPGGFADKQLVHVEDLARVPDGLDISLGAVATDAGMTSYHALVVRGGLTADMSVGVIGMGGLGQIATRVAVLKGADVHVAEPKRDLWPLAESLGAAGLVADAADWKGRDFDLVVDYAGFDTAARAIDAVRPGGTVVTVGIGAPEFTIPSQALLWNKNLIGSIGGTVADIEDLYAMMTAGDLAPAYEEIGFDEVQRGLERLEAAQVTGRLVARFGS
ncbi:zinc-binding dehydrogenase [Saccharopolyspora sp. HNM0983]|uniref:Zinc-binding dehydrogenase n=1 Tax=Saccharopolyspora montiporae TaxID=2781240 RepID=A0A929B7Y5_9PSEU|nr:zinc-binding dehydrogenase [Saccharopolyspora sp. HNM0983]MBE9373921.1 zinc-binding dehydrogenase [Saccharopolyspora sp. HNM0983]